MRFSVDAHAIGRHLTGNEVYIRNLLNGFAALDQSSEFIAYLTSDIMDKPDAVPARMQRRTVSANPFIRLGFDLTRLVYRDAPDLLHVQYTSPLVCPVPVVVSVHDVSFLEHPDYFPLQRAKQLQITVKRTVAAAARVLTVSEFSRERILRAYDVDPDRVIVVPNAASPVFRPISPAVATRRVRERFGITTPFLMTVGDLQPRKNQLGLIEAFDALLQRCPSLPHHLVIVGKDTWFSPRVHARAEGSAAGRRIQFTGWVSDDDLVNLYNAADCLVFPSHYEGFGLPVLEAMACGCAVACSDRSAVPEVADSAALLFHPDDHDAMISAMKDLLIDHELRTRMERLGLHRASLFSWERSARQTLNVYYEVAGAASGVTTASEIRK